MSKHPRHLLSNRFNHSDNGSDHSPDHLEPSSRKERLKSIIDDHNYGFYHDGDFDEQSLIEHDKLQNEREPIIDSLDLIERVTHKLDQYRSPLFKYSHLAPQSFKQVTRKERLAYRVLCALNEIPYLLMACPAHRFSPYIESFLEAAHQFNLEGISMQEVLDRDTIDDLNDFVEAVIENTHSAGFLLREQRCHERVEKNRREVQSYVDRLFQLHSRLLLVRVDLGYQKHIIQDDDHPLEISRVINDRKRLINHVQRNYGDALEGFVWKLEKGLLKSYHYHMLFLFNGREKHGDIAIAHQIGQYWRERIVKGEGTYFNCNTNHYNESGIGMIEHHDHVKRGYLEEHVIDYLVKPDYAMSHLMCDGHKVRTLGKGLMPPEPHEVRRGRPRLMNSR